MEYRNGVRWLMWIAVALFLSVGPGNGCAPQRSPFREPPALVADAQNLESSKVSAHLEIPIEAGKSVLWCATFQLAWNEASDLAGGQLRFAPPENPMVAILNRRSVAAADLDPASYIAAAGYMRDGICQRIDRLMREKFDGHATPKLLKDAGAGLRPQDIVAYCYLFKQLDFPTPFERAESRLTFGGTPVASFGMGPYKPGHEEMARGVLILDYKNPDDFVIELATQSKQDHLILAKIAPHATLASTVAAVTQRVEKAKPIPAEPTDILAVPKMNFDIMRHYTDLLGQRLIATAPGMPEDAMILVADQNIRFLMDEKGVQLQSEAHMEFGCSAERTPVPLHELVLDKPFLLLLSREGCKSPYLALWIGNADLLEK